MQDQNNKSSTNLNQPAAGASSSATSASTNATDASTSANTPADAKINRAAQSDFVRKIIDKINHSENILITLSRDPSVDELAAAIGLTLYLDGIQKHATAIYSGRTPDALKFLQPDATFERTTDGLQDFIIALNKEKADHLRYKLEGDFVKVFITPYKEPITKDDLSFSYGDYNVNFVIAINVPSASKLDEALREHGRIMHDASAVNITTGVPGRFGEIEWSNPAASSLCEMVADLIFALQGPEETPLDPDIATALLTGIVAATDRFSNANTNSDTLSLASKLMSMGANQQLITSNIQGNEVIHNDENLPSAAPAQPQDSTNLSVDHDSDSDSNSTSANPAAASAPSADSSADPAPTSAISSTNNVTPDDVVVQPVLPSATPTNAATIDQMQLPTSQPTPPASDSTSVEEMHLPGVAAQTAPDLQPPEPQPAPQPKNYAEMMEAALADAAAPSPTPQMITTPATSPLPGASPAEASTPDASMPNTFAPAAPAPESASAPSPFTPPTSSPLSSPEPVAAPDAPILPPPPAPATGPDMMPPVLPPVQTPPANF